MSQPALQRRTAEEPRASHLRIFTAAAALVAAAVLAACASTTPSDPATVERRFYEGRCGVCHVPFHRNDFAASQWPELVAKFGPRAGLTRSQRERILRYLTADPATQASSSATH